MIWFLDFLIFCNLIIPAIFVSRNCLSKNGVEVDHNLLFSVGFIFYCVTPVILGLIGFERNARIFSPWYEIFNQLSNFDLVLYLLICLLFYVAFVFGDLIGKSIVLKRSLERVPFDERLLHVFWFMGIVLAGIYSYKLWDVFFTGYSKGGWHFGKGTFTAISVYLLVLALIYSVKKQERLGASSGFFRSIINKYFALYLVVSILLMSLGGRMWFVSTVLMLIVYRTVYFKRIKYITFASIIIFFAILAPMFAHIRTGKEIGVDDLTNIAYVKNMGNIFFSDSMFISAGLFDFIKNNTMPIVSFPKYLISRFLNIIPSFLWPLKAGFILHPAHDGYSFFSVYGALHPFIATITNFGAIGGIIVPFSLSACLGFLKKDKRYLSKVMYILITGWIALIFFRDFNNAIIKLIIEFSIVIPIFIGFILHIVPIAARAFKLNKA
jgi:hypothetical protein